ncbi:Kinesin-like protein 6 [Mycena indigotica]|uniref:Kinesin-like protein n=1 Tax=Mycena indigotica TaxID=2126181 RepID=A0A8H6W4I5_9AGAR|nr:Kinesin-like protein 6 [Mycena indigotica]KAF7301503.1 Kinesin-like protein 6 [Mycena indigotica]
MVASAGSITVAVRVRPPNSWEAARLPEPCYDTTIRGEGALSTPRTTTANTSSLREVVQIIDDRILTFDPAETDPSKAFLERGFLPPGTKRYKDKRFMFDRVFNDEAQQQDVYQATAQPLLQGVLDGYNATVFAYGATGCGKTHTISGTETDPGIIYLTMADLFQRIDDRRDEWTVEVMVTFLEIYNEEIRDLLADPSTPSPRGGLCIREDKTVKVSGLVELRPNSAEEVKEIVLLGNTRRTQSPTLANATSSRSHAVLQVHITQSPRTASLSEERTMATLSIIDLAGSERAAATTNMGQRMVEGANINKSLLALGNCINALCESGGAVRHVPYRNSKLTRLLKFSLGGNCKTVMIVCIAPTSNHFDDTHNTLVYADRATKIKTKVVTRNILNVDRHVGRYVEAINRLNVEVEELKAKLAGKNQAENDIQRRKKAEAAAEVERSRKDVRLKFEQTTASIVDGAICTGKLSVAKSKLDAINARLRQINASGPLSPDLEAEKALLQALAGPEEQTTQSDSPLTARLKRSSNSSAMFDATMRAVSERRSERLDDVSGENVKLEARCSKAEMEKLKAEGERDSLKEAVQDMSQTLVHLVGMLSRCTVLLGDAATSLGSSGGPDDVPRVAAILGTMREKNDEAFTKLVGHSTASYNNSAGLTDDFTGYADAGYTRRISSGPAALQQTSTTTAVVSSRRSSSYGSRPSTANTSVSNTSAGSPRRTYRAPRKSLRSSAQPYRRVADKEKKSVQWRDEAGQGDLNAISFIPADTSSSWSMDDSSLPQRSTSLGGSESEWEDEKTDDSLNSASAPPARSYGSLGVAGAKRSRPSRLDPGFLKSKTKRTALGSLAEDDESSSSPEKPQRILSDVMNQLDNPELASPSKRHTQAKNGNPLGRSTGGRRRSAIGTSRNEKGRRRSSLIPQLSPSNGEPKLKRVLLASPAKRTKRVSLTKMPKLSTGRTSLMANLAALAPDPNNISADLSMNKGAAQSKPTWR